MGEKQDNERGSYSVHVSRFDKEVLPYLNSTGESKIYGDGSVAFFMDGGGVIVPFEPEDNSGEMTLLVTRCSQGVHDKLSEICDE